MRRSVCIILLWAAAMATAACDDSSSEAAKGTVESRVESRVESSATASPAAPPAAPAPPEPPHAPDIIIDRSTVAIGNEHVATGEPALAERIGALITGQPAIQGHTVDLVAMRNAKPSEVAAVVGAVRAAQATGAKIKTAARDDTTQSLALTFASSVPDCAVVMWIAKDGVIDVWPAGGGAVKRVGRGLAGPDMTLGTDAVRAQWAGCGAPAVVVGAEDTMTWGLVFDLATTVLSSPGSRANAAVLVTTATPGRKLAL
jgi:hypothetical protein